MIVVRRLELTGSLSPWPRAAVVWWLAGNVGAAVLLGVAWFGASGELRTSSQMNWVVVASLGVVLAGVSNLTRLRNGNGRIHDRASRLTIATGGARGPRSASDAMRVATPAMTRFHRPDCLLVVGKPVEAADLEAHCRAGRQPCAMCRP